MRFLAYSNLFHMVYFMAVNPRHSGNGLWLLRHLFIGQHQGTRNIKITFAWIERFAIQKHSGQYAFHSTLLRLSELRFRNSMIRCIYVCMLVYTARILTPADHISQTRTAYKDYMKSIARLLGGGHDSHAKMMKIYDFEQKLAMVGLYAAHLVDYIEHFSAPTATLHDLLSFTNREMEKWSFTVLNHIYDHVYWSNFTSGAINVGLKRLY